MCVSAMRRVSEKNNCPSHCSCPSSSSFPPLCIRVIHMHIWRVAERAEEEMDGWRPVVCYRDRHKSIIYGGKIPCLLCLVSHVKAYISNFSSLLVFYSRSHMEMSEEHQNPRSKGFFFGLLEKFVNLHLQYVQQQHQMCVICSTFVVSLFS